jgi:hypothetical protein
MSERGSELPDPRSRRNAARHGQRFTVAALVFYAVCFGAACGIAGLSGHSLVYASPGDAAAGVRWARDAGVGLAAAGAGIALSSLLTAATRWGRLLAEELARLLGPLRPATCLLLAAASGIAEEALFRGALQPLLGLVGASLLFGIAHLAPRRALLPWTGFAVLAGFGLGALYDWTGNLVAPVVAHAALNAVNLTLLARRAR